MINNDKITTDFDGSGKHSKSNVPYTGGTSRCEGKADRNKFSTPETNNKNNDPIKIKSFSKLKSNGGDHIANQNKMHKTHKEEVPTSAENQAEDVDDIEEPKSEKVTHKETEALWDFLPTFIAGFHSENDKSQETVDKEPEVPVDWWFHHLCRVTVDVDSWTKKFFATKSQDDDEDDINLETEYEKRDQELQKLVDKEAEVPISGDWFLKLNEAREMLRGKLGFGKSDESEEMVDEETEEAPISGEWLLKMNEARHVLRQREYENRRNVRHDKQRRDDIWFKKSSSKKFKDKYDAYFSKLKNQIKKVRESITKKFKDIRYKLESKFKKKKRQ